VDLFRKKTDFQNRPQVRHQHWIKLILFEPNLLGHPLPSKVNHKRYDWFFQIDIQFNPNWVTIIPISRETKAIMHKQKLVWPVAITVVSLLSRLQRPSLKIDETKGGFFIVLLRVIPVELFLSFATYFPLFVFLSFDLWLQRLNFSVSVLISVKVNFINLLVFRVPMVVVENLVLIFNFIFFVQHNFLLVDEKL